MKLDDSYAGTFVATCGSDNVVHPFDLTTWPTCRPTSNCTGLPAPPSTSDGSGGVGNATLLSGGHVFGPCVGADYDYEEAPSCPGVRVMTTAKRTKSSGGGNQRVFSANFRTNYSANEMRDLHLLVTYSYEVSFLKVRSCTVVYPFGYGTTSKCATSSGTLTRMSPLRTIPVNGC